MSTRETVSGVWWNEEHNTSTRKGGREAALTARLREASREPLAPGMGVGVGGGELLLRIAVSVLFSPSQALPIQV